MSWFTSFVRWITSKICLSGLHHRHQHPIRHHHRRCVPTFTIAIFSYINSLIEAVTLRAATMG